MIFGFFLGISLAPFDERLSAVEVCGLFGFGSVSSDIVDVTGTLSKSISIMRTFVDVIFFGIGLSMGLVIALVLFVFSMIFGLTVAVGLFNGFVDGWGFSNDGTLLGMIDFRSSKSLWSDDDDNFRRIGSVTHEWLVSTLDCFGIIFDEIGSTGLGTLNFK